MDDTSALAHQQELEYQQWFEEWVDTEDYINHVNTLAYEVFSSTPTNIEETLQCQ